MVHLLIYNKYALL